MTDAEMDEYVASGEWMDKAGGYAIQLSADRYVSSIEGSFSNVVGLPMELVQRILARTAAVHCED
jgi:septum formation protein